MSLFPASQEKKKEYLSEILVSTQLNHIKKQCSKLYKNHTVDKNNYNFKIAAPHTTHFYKEKGGSLSETFLSHQIYQDISMILGNNVPNFIKIIGK